MQVSFGVHVKICAGVIRWQHHHDAWLCCTPIFCLHTYMKNRFRNPFIFTPIRVLVYRCRLWTASPRRAVGRTWTMSRTSSPHCISTTSLRSTRGACIFLFSLSFSLSLSFFLSPVFFVSVWLFVCVYLCFSPLSRARARSVSLHLSVTHSLSLSLSLLPLFLSVL